MTRREPPTALTPREREALELAALGLTCKEIAAEMGCTVPTVKRLSSNAYARLDVSDRLSACVAAGILVRPARVGNPGAPSSVARGRPDTDAGVNR